MPGGGIYTEVTGTNLNDYGDSGSFESAFAPPSWGANFNTPAIVNHTVTRSSTQAHAGTYSARIQRTTTVGALSGGKDLIYKFASWVPTAFKKYRITAWVYTPSANLIADVNSVVINFDSLVNGEYFRVTKTVIGATDTWAQIEIRLLATTAFRRYLGIRLSGPLFQLNLNGILYVDDVKVVEIEENISNYDLTAVIVNASGPDVADGSVTLTASPTGTYDYSKNGGITWQASNVFSALALSLIHI